MQQRKNRQMLIHKDKMQMAGGIVGANAPHAKKIKKASIDSCKIFVYLTSLMQTVPVMFPSKSCNVERESI